MAIHPMVGSQSSQVSTADAAQLEMAGAGRGHSQIYQMD